MVVQEDSRFAPVPTDPTITSRFSSEVLDSPIRLRSSCVAVY